MKRLVDLDPQFLDNGGEGVQRITDRVCPACQGAKCDACHQSGKEYEPAPLRVGVGVSFDCPCGCGSPAYIPFRNPLDGGPPLETENHTWERTGDTFETLTLRPSIQRVGGCNWHGFLTNGEFTGA